MLKKLRFSNELRLEICESLRLTMRELTYSEAESTMEFGARPLHWYGPPSKKTTAQPSLERPLEG
jgi:hypothetical protein